jgi:hypothetical protein
MSKRIWSVLAGLCGLVVFTPGAVCSHAQSSAVQEKAPMYSYIANWQIPRTHWAQMPQTEAADKPIMDKALADGTLIGYGDDETLVHTADGETHDDWFSSMSMGGLLKVLSQLYASGNTSSPATDATTKHWDEVYVSRYYNWHPGAYKSAYTMVASYQLKEDAPFDAVDILSKNAVAPLLEKLLTDGTILEYEIDEQAMHTDAPGRFSIVYLTPTGEGIDKVNAALAETLKAQPLILPAFGSMINFSAHRDELLLSEGTYK